MHSNTEERRSPKNGTPLNSATTAIDSGIASKKAPIPLREGILSEQRCELNDLSAERHYSVAELAKLWNLSKKTIRRMFENEPGVLQWGSQETRSKRSYVTLRIPETVALRLHRRLRIAG
jgi:hypothetical protein